MHKLSYFSGGDWVEHSHPPTFAQESRRIVAGVPHGDPELFERLLLSLEPPYFLLYVLHTPRGEGRPGRYQSPSLSAEQVREFIASFTQFLSQDARFDIWGHSPSDKGTVVWERHNLLYAYEPMEGFLRQLRALGFDAGAPIFPRPISTITVPSWITMREDCCRRSSGPGRNCGRKMSNRMLATYD